MNVRSLRCCLEARESNLGSKLQIREYTLSAFAPDLPRPHPGDDRGRAARPRKQQLAVVLMRVV